MTKKNIKKYAHTKKDIENIVNQIRYRLDELEMSSNVAIYFNGKCYKDIGHWDDEQGAYLHNWVLEENLYPIDYCEYAPENNIICISSEGELYDAMNYNFMYLDERILPDKSLYCEMGTTWFYILCPSRDEWEDWETTHKPGDYRKI